MVEREMAAVLEALEDTGSPQGARKVLEDSGYEILHPPETGTPQEDIESVERGSTGMVPYQVLDPERGRVLEITATVNPSQGDTEVSTRTLLRGVEQEVRHDELEEYVDRYNQLDIEKLTVSVEPVRTGVPGEDESLMSYPVRVFPRYLRNSSSESREGKDAKELQLAKIKDSEYDAADLVAFTYTERFRALVRDEKAQRILGDMAYDRAEEIASGLGDRFDVEGPDRGAAPARSTGRESVLGRAVSPLQ